MAEPLLALTHTTLRYEHGITALDDVTLYVAEGERICVLGPNGSGKSTLASVLCGLLAPDEGDVTLVGERVCIDGHIDFEGYRRARRQVGLVFQNPDDQIVTSVVEEDVAFGPENLGVPSSKIGERVARELHRVALDRYAQADPSNLSGGQKQRVAIAGALAMEPRVLVLDEPGALLDVRGRRGIMRVMDELHRSGTTIVHVTHFMEEALAADRVVVLSAGRLILQGTPQEVFSHCDELTALGLEDPFVAQLAQALRAQGLDVPWTCNEDELLAALRAMLGPGGCEEPAHDGTAFPTSPSALQGDGEALTAANLAAQQGQDVAHAATSTANRQHREATPTTSSPFSPRNHDTASHATGPAASRRHDVTLATTSPTSSQVHDGMPAITSPSDPLAQNPQPSSSTSLALKSNTPPTDASHTKSYTPHIKSGTSHPSPSAAAIAATSLTYSYGDIDAREERHPALDGVTFSFARGTHASVVGQTGSGKSTLLRLLCALEAPDAGRLVVDGIDTSNRKLRRQLHGRVGYVMQHPERQLFAETVWEDVAYGPTNLGLAPREIEQRCQQALELVGLTGREESSPFHLSGGQQRLCALAGILAMEPHILVLDEPTAGLDPHGRAQLRAIIRRIHAAGTTIVQVTHSMDDAAASMHVLVLNEGKVLMQGTPEQVFCAQTGAVLRSSGLGLPQPLQWALRLAEAGVSGLGEPLTLDELVAQLTAAANSAARPTPEGVS